MPRFGVASGTAGDLYVAYLSYSFSPSIAHNCAALVNYFADDVGSDIIMIPAGAAGFAGYVPIDYTTGFTSLTTSLANYDIDFTDSLPYLVKSVVCFFISNDLTNNFSGPTISDKDGNTNSYLWYGDTSATSVRGQINVPVYDYSGASNKARLRMATTGASDTVTFLPVGFHF